MVQMAEASLEWMAPPPGLLVKIEFASATQLKKCQLPKFHYASVWTWVGLHWLAEDVIDWMKSTEHSRFSVSSISEPGVYMGPALARQKDLN